MGYMFYVEKGKKYHNYTFWFGFIAVFVNFPYNHSWAFAPYSVKAGRIHDEPGYFNIDKYQACTPRPIYRFEFYKINFIKLHFHIFKKSVY